MQSTELIQEKFDIDLRGAEVLGYYQWAPHTGSGQIHASGLSTDYGEHGVVFARGGRIYDVRETEGNTLGNVRRGQSVEDHPDTPEWRAYFTVTPEAMRARFRASLAM